MLILKTLSAFALVFSTYILNVSAATTDSPSSTVKLYTIDCGTITASNIHLFSSNGDFDGQSAILPVPCFLIQHAKGYLLWDTGLEQSLAKKEGGLNVGGGFHYGMRVTLTDQLHQIGLAPEDIDYLALSHWHSDHTGNANLFTASTLILNAAEYQFMFSDDVKSNAEIYGLYAALENAKTILFPNIHDVFGDGTVIIRSMPGHTVGHSVLEVNLKNSSTYLLTGDLYTHNEGRKLKAVPVFNSDAETTKKSMDEFEVLAKELDAKVIIQHEQHDFLKLPRFPSYLD